ncbi:unnamed protein product [Prunus armeniaca]|uniref:Uncharacterized protein n=2 Tax=Prunus armeniaca TaxID=36596 RepID=A0A6J5XPN1_PRUAR|nr:unnamed protein product [Prunus armeniaca]CAB4312984.1 unnamed protein product [Prunus armeniaca]
MSSINFFLFSSAPSGPQKTLILGFGSDFFTYFSDIARNALYYRGIGHAFHTICREEGFLGLYKGLGATLLGVGPSIAISFSVYEALRSFWQSERPNDSTVMVSLACGSLSGIASSTATFPLDVVRRRMQLEGAGGRARIYNTGLVGTFKHIIRTEGLRGLYRGILPEYYKVVPSVGIVFMTYETLKMLLSRIQASDSCFSLGVSGISNSVMCAKRVILRLAIQHWVDLQSSYLNLTCLVVQVERTKMQVFLRLVGLLALPCLKAFLKFLLQMYQLASRADKKMLRSSLSFIMDQMHDELLKLEGQPSSINGLKSSLRKDELFLRRVGDYQRALCQASKMVERISSSRWTQTL